MSGSSIKAFIATALLFGGAVWYIAGPQLPSMSKLKDLWPAKAESKTVNIRKKNYSRKTSSKTIGFEVDNYQGVSVYDNGPVSNVAGRNVTKDGYNLGLKYQCVEFGKRFFYERHGHKMPDSYGHAKDFFNPQLNDGQLNRARGMYQFKNGSPTKPQPEDMVIIGGSRVNPFGHLFIITKVSNTAITFIQQNPGVGNPSRAKYELLKTPQGWYIDNPDVKGWLRMG